MKEEVKKVLKMVEEKKITAEEGEKLIEAIDDDTSVMAENNGINRENGEPKYLRIHVIDADDKIDVNIPVSLIEVGLKLGTQFGLKDSIGGEKLKDIDFAKIIEAIKQGARGKLVDMKTSDTTIEIYVE